MPAATDFRLYHSNSLEILAGLMASELRTPAAGQALLEPDTVLIPQPSMRRWLQATLAQAHGIAANLEFLTPGEFVARALDANAEGRGDDLNADAMRWRLLGLLGDAKLMRQPALQPLRGYLTDATGGTDALKAWSLAGELSATFEKYQAWRRDWLLAWDAGQAPRDPQAVLWRQLAGSRAHRARRIQRYLERFGAESTLAPAGLPTRLFAFATLNVSPDVLRVIASQSRAGTLHFYLPTPTRAYWGDIRSLPGRLQADADAAFAPADAADDNPLLQAWGAAGRDFMAVLGGYEIVHPDYELGVYDDPESPLRDLSGETLLQRIRRDLLHRRAPPREAWRDEVDRHDASLQVHACHTPLREVQVLHDQLRALLEDPRFEPPLQPREIAVLAPDIDPYVPYVDAVFGGMAGRVDFIPYSLADTSPLLAEPLAAAFARLLGLPVSRLGLHEVLDLVATPAIAEHAGLDADALARLRDWLQQAGARWGLDAEHRARHGAPADGHHTWQFAIDRLLVGMASGSDALVGEVAGLPQLEGGDLASLDALLGLLRTLARFERALAAPLTAMQWRERLLALLAALLPERPREAADERALTRLRQLVEQFAESADRAQLQAPIAAEVMRAYFQSALAQPDTRAPLMSGAVSFGRMVPLRLLPFRVICVLGLNDGDFPRRDPAGGINQIVRELTDGARRRGDRSLRDDDRFLFLQLLASAADVFYLSYLGADPRDGSARQPSTLVSDLVAVASRYHADPQHAAETLVVAHPLQPFSADAFGAALGGAIEPRRFSYRAEWLPAAQTSTSARRELGAWIDTALPAQSPQPAEVSLAELRDFLRNPVQAFLRQRLQVRLPDESQARSDDEPLASDHRDVAHLRQAAFDALVADDSRALLQRLRAQGALPAGAIGSRALDAAMAHVEPFAALHREFTQGQAASLQALEVDIGGRRVHGRIDAHPHGLARLRFDALHGPSQVAHGFDWLFACAAGRETPLVQFALVEGRATRIERAAVPAQQARDALAQLMALRDDGLAQPLPFGARSGWAWYDARNSTKRRERAWNYAQESWRGSDHAYGEGTDPAIALALRGRDPFESDAQGEHFRVIAWQVFEALLHARTGTEPA